MKIVVTGSSGFIGSYLVDQLVRNNHEVIAVGRRADALEYYRQRGVQFVSLDITKPKQFDRLPSGIDAVAHLAGLLSIDVYGALDYLMNNTYGTYNVLEYCRKHDVPKLVFAMTHSDVNRADETVITEETPQKFSGLVSVSTSTPYIISKVAAQHFIEDYTLNYGIKGVSLRLPGVRGYGARFISFWGGKPEINTFQKFVMKAQRSEPLEIWGKYESYRDLVYVKDVACGFVQALTTSNIQGLYNIASGTGLTILQEAQAIIGAFSPTGKPSPIVFRPDIPEVKRKNCVFSVDKAKRDFDYTVHYSYEAAMRDYAEEMRVGRFKYLVARQEDVLMKRSGLTLDELLKRQEEVQ